MSMNIQYFGHSYFKIETKGATLAVNPYSELPNLKTNKPPRFKADILLISEPTELFNNQNTILGTPFVLAEPGEVEINQILIKSIFNFSFQKNDVFFNKVIFKIEAEDIEVGIINDLREKVIKEKLFEELSGVDILILPVGGDSPIDSELAISVINQIEPKIVIPAFYYPLKKKLEKEEEIYNDFLATIKKKPELMEKLTIKKNQLPQATKIIILKNLS